MINFKLKTETMKKSIKKLDLVGHQVSLNFNKEGKVHKTFLGGIVSSLVLAAIIYIAGNKTVGMIWHQDDDIA